MDNNRSSQQPLGKSRSLNDIKESSSGIGPIHNTSEFARRFPEHEMALAREKREKEREQEEQNRNLGLGIDTEKKDQAAFADKLTQSPPLSREHSNTVSPVLGLDSSRQFSSDPTVSGSRDNYGADNELEIREGGTQEVKGKDQEYTQTRKSVDNEKDFEIALVKPQESQGKRPESTLPENPFTVEAILAREERLTSDDLEVQRNAYLDYYLLKKGKEKSSEGVQLERTEEQKRQDEQDVKKLIEDYKKRSVAEVLDHINEDGNKRVLDAITNHTVDKLGKVLEIPEGQEGHYMAEVRRLYSEKGPKAETLYNYIEFLHVKGKFTLIGRNFRQESKQAIYVMNKNGHTKRRYAKKLPTVLEGGEMLDPYKARHDMLVKRHGHLKLEGDNKHERESKRLKETIEIRKEYERAKAKLSADKRVIKDIELLQHDLLAKVAEYDKSKNVEKKFIAKIKLKGVQIALRSFRDQFQSEDHEGKILNLERRMEELRSLTLKHGSHPWSSRLNNWSSFLGFTAVGVPSLVAGAVGLGITIASASG